MFLRLRGGSKMGQKSLPRWLQHGMPIWDPKIVPNVSIGPPVGAELGSLKRTLECLGSDFLVSEGPCGPFEFCCIFCDFQESPGAEAPRPGEGTRVVPGALSRLSTECKQLLDSQLSAISRKARHIIS